MRVRMSQRRETPSVGALPDAAAADGVPIRVTMKSCCSILAEAASEVPDKPLFVFPETRWRSEETLTYGELASRAGAAARTLSHDAHFGDRALLLFATGPAVWEALWGCLAAGVIAVPLKTPNLNRRSEQLEQVCRDCTPSVVMTDEETANLLTRRAEVHPYFSRLSVITPDQWRIERRELAPKRLTGDVTAYLQYTSGSTSRPKGVQISHGNLLANAELIRRGMEIRIFDDRGVTWLPHYHDMGLVGGYLETLFTKNTSWCLPPEEFALRPEHWLQLISKHSASICGGPDFAYRFCADRVKEKHLEGVDLSCWRVAYIGAERIRPETLQGFTERFSPYGFRDSAFFPCYGLAEATLMATGGPAEASPVVRRVSSSALLENRIAPPGSEADATTLAGSGKAFEESPIVILDPTTGRPVGDDHIGEVFVSGPAVTRGYFNRSELNNELFRDMIIDGRPERFLQTGDLGFLSEGELFITGRTKEMMIVRGRNLYPDDIERLTCEAHKALEPGGAVAFSVELAGQESLVIATEVRRSAVNMDVFEPVLAAIRHRIVEAFGVTPSEILLLRPATIPRTSSGKLRRLDVRRSYVDGSIRGLVREQP